VEEIRINYKMVWVKGSMSIGEIGINYKMVGLGQGFHEHRRSSNTLQIVGIGFRPSIGGVLTTLQLLGERLGERLRQL
jgi:hypothetical protein